MQLRVYEVVTQTQSGLVDRVVTGYSKQDVVGRFERGEVVQIKQRGPYMGEGPFGELRKELLKDDNGLVTGEEVA